MTSDKYCITTIYKKTKRLTGHFSRIVVTSDRTPSFTNHIIKPLVYTSATHKVERGWVILCDRYLYREVSFLNQWVRSRRTGPGHTPELSDIGGELVRTLSASNYKQLNHFLIQEFYLKKDSQLRFIHIFPCIDTSKMNKILLFI